MSPVIFRRLLWYFLNASNLRGNSHASDIIRKAAEEFAWQAWEDCWKYDWDLVDEEFMREEGMLPAERIYAKPILDLMLATGQHQEIEEALVENDEVFRLACEVVRSQPAIGCRNWTLEYATAYGEYQSLAVACLRAKIKRSERELRKQPIK